MIIKNVIECKEYYKSRDNILISGEFKRQLLEETATTGTENDCHGR